MSYVKQPTGEIQVVASQKDREQQVSKHSSEKQFPKCTNGHSNGVSVTSTRIGMWYVKRFGCNTSFALRLGTFLGVVCIVCAIVARPLRLEG